MLHPGPEVAVGEALQLFHQLPALAVWDVLGKQQTVDKQAQLSIGEVSVQVPIGEERFLLAVGLYPHRLAALYVKPQVNQIQQVPADGFPVRFHVVLPF